MKKRVLSMLMALALCLTLLPAPAWAAEADAPEGGTIVQEEQQEKTPAAESPAISEQAAENGIAAQNGGDSTVENAVAEVTSGGTTYYYTDLSAALAKVNTDGGAQEQCSCITLCTEGNTNSDCPVCGAEGADLTACKGTSAQEGIKCICTVPCAEGAVNTDCPVCGIEGADLTQCQSEANAITVEKVQELIDALPDALTEENAGDVSAMLGEIDAAMAALGDEERAALDLTQYQAVIAALATLAAAQGEIALYANENNKPKGDGTEAHPYQITSTDELEWFRDAVNEGKTDICAELMNNLDFDNKQNDGYWTWTPIGNSKDNAYVGTFDGNGYEIKKIRLVDVQAQSQTNRGLFGWIGAGGKVQDLAVSVRDVGNSSLSVSNSGLLSVNNAGTIERCSATISNLLHTDNFGMIAYENSGTITDCWSYVGATGSRLSISDKAAGIARTNTGTISNCFFRGDLRRNMTNGKFNPEDYAIAENQSGGTITNCYYRDGNGGRNGEVYLDGDSTTVILKETDACTGGEVTWLLNDSGRRDTWRIGSNKYPSVKKTDRRISYNSETGKYVPGDPPHMHGDVEFTKVTALSEITASGNYYIDADVEVSSTWAVSGDVVLCLNGQTVTAKDAIAPAIKVSGSNSLTLLACKEGKITGSGGTSILVDSGKLTLGGKAQVTGNDKNILLAANQKIHFDSLDPSAKFGISVEGQESLSDRVAVTDTTGGQYFAQLVADGFKNDGSGFELYLNNDGDTVMLGKQSVHRHCICGDNSKEVNGHTHDADITFLPWTRTDELPTSGDYYLTRNVTLAQREVSLGNANVCLNGYTVTLRDVGRINPSGTTQLTDCSVNGKLESYPGKANGGVAISGGSKFYLYGGTLNGVKVEIGQTGGGTFNMYGGKITGNTKGTVVGQSKTSGSKSAITINMYGGEISGNHISGSQGGGVFVGSGSQFNMYGGKIINNTTTADGGGVYIAPKGNAYQAGTMTIRGDAVIQDNKANGVTNNVSLPKGSTIKIDGKMDASAQIGVTTKAGLSAGNVDIATATDTGWVAAKNFTSDNSAYHVGLVNDGKTVQLQVHSHQWKYSVSPDGTTITAKCTAGNCDLADSNGGSVQIVPPSGSLIYDGAEKTAKLEKPTWKGDTVAEADIKYTKDVDNTFTGNPKDAGTYTASIALTNGDGSTATASVEYTIAQAKLTMTGTPAATASYNENLAVKDIPITGLSVTFNGTAVNGAWKFDSDAKPEVGDTTAYTATFKPESGTYNYETLTTQIVPTITKGTYNGAAMTTTKNVLAGEAQTGVEVTTGLMPNITDAKIVEATEASDLNNIIENVTHTDNTVKFDVNNVSGDELTATITVTYSSKNYENFTSTITVKTVKKDPANVTITGLPQTVTYGQEFTLTASQTGDTTSANKKWTWDYDREYFKLVGPNANTETITLQAIKAGTPSKGITATYESGTHKGSKTVTPGVAQKEVTVSGITAANKEYDGNTDATVNASGATITGIVSGDSLTITATGSFADADVGNGKAVNLTLGALSGASTGNYKLAASGNQTTATANITAKNVSISAATVNNKDYDGNANATVASVTITGVSGALSMGTDFDVTSATFPDADADTANVDVTINVALKGTAANNYNLTNGMGYVVTSAAKINKATYSGSAPTKTVNILKNYAGVQTGTLTAADFFTTAPAEAKITNAVPNADSSNMMSYAGADASGNFTYASKTNITAASNENWTITISSKNYTDITATLTFSPVDRTDAGVTISSVPASKTYGESFTLTASVTDAGTGTGSWTWTSNDPSVLQVTGIGASATVKALKAGSATISAKYESDTTMGEQTTAPITVGKRVITVTADNKSMTVNGTLPTFTVTYGNLPSGVQAADIFGTLASASTTTDGKTTGSFDITVTTPVLKTEAGANYEVGAVTKGTLTVNPRSSSGGGGGGSVSTYSVTVGKTENGSVSVSPKSASKGDTVTITVTPDKGYVLETLTVLDKNDKEIKLTEKNGKYTFTMPAGKVEVKVTFMDDNTMLNYFVDVKAGDYFYDAVKWAAEKGITSGTDATHFSPNAACTRAQIVTFLWRAAGSPEPKGTSSFADVPSDSYYTKAVAWAVENGITGGTGDGKFSPNATCTREQAVAFLYRASGSPAVSGGSAFNDVAANAYYADAVAWAEKNEITGGIGGGLFGSGNDCTRAQIVTFLYRTYQGK